MQIDDSRPWDDLLFTGINVVFRMHPEDIHWPPVITRTMIFKATSTPKTYTFSSRCLHRARLFFASRPSRHPMTKQIILVSNVVKYASFSYMCIYNYVAHHEGCISNMIRFIVLTVDLLPLKVQGTNIVPQLTMVGPSKHFIYLLETESCCPLLRRADQEYVHTPRALLQAGHATPSFMRLICTCMGTGVGDAHRHSPHLSLTFRD